MIVDNTGRSQVTVKKQELLAIMRKNRETHKAAAEEAEAGYRKEVVKALRRMLASAKSGGKLETELNLQKPVNCTADYDRIIRMIEMSTKDEIQISENQFTQYVLDEWHWKAAFQTTNAIYSAKR